MSYWRNVDRKNDDDIVIALRGFAGIVGGISIGVGVCHDFPSAGAWLRIPGILLALIFLTVAQSRSKKLNQDAAKNDNISVSSSSKV
jgi:hypothetical protein